FDVGRAIFEAVKDERYVEPELSTEPPVTVPKLSTAAPTAELPVSPVALPPATAAPAPPVASPEPVSETHFRIVPAPAPRPSPPALPADVHLEDRRATQEGGAAHVELLTPPLPHLVPPFVTTGLRPAASPVTVIPSTLAPSTTRSAPGSSR